MQRLSQGALFRELVQDMRLGAHVDNIDDFDFEEDIEANWQFNEAMEAGAALAIMDIGGNAGIHNAARAGNRLVNVVRAFLTPLPDHGGNEYRSGLIEYIGPHHARWNLHEPDNLHWAFQDMNV